MTPTPNDPCHTSIERHPAYATIGASRVSSGHGIQLFGSDFAHQHFITIKIRTAELMRGSSEDRIHGDVGSIISVALSESQWAQFVSSLNVGTGVPCTLERLQDEMIPGIERKVERKRQFESELHARLEGVRESIREAEDMVKALPVSQKKKDEILHQLRVAGGNMEPNLKFTADQFGEYMEDVVTKAKAEIHAYAAHIMPPADRTLTAGEPRMPVRMLEEPATDAEVIE